MAKIKQIKSDSIYHLKISLDHTKPSIWRRFIVESDIKLPDLHKVIQTVMGWYNAHLHQFRINNKFYSMPNEDSLSEYIDYRKTRLDQVVTKEMQKFHYDYDFGDGWEHTMIVEKISLKDKNIKYPLCIDGKRNCPPEDCGGTGGYEDIVEIMKNPQNDAYNEMIDWLGGKYDPEEFEIEKINHMLKEKDFGCVDLFE